MNDNGKADVSGLTVGSYQLREVTPPGGYLKLEDPVTFSVSYDGAVSFTDTALVTYRSASSTFEVGNEPGASLPNAGGPGTRLFTILGALLALGAAMLLWKRQRITMQ